MHIGVEARWPGWEMCKTPRPLIVQHMHRALLAIACATAAAAVLVPLTTAAQPAAAPRTAPTVDGRILDGLNAIRRERGLFPLRANAALVRAADEHSRDMVSRGYFAHDDADGSFSDRLERFYSSANARSWSVGENLLRTSRRLNATSALALWMASPPHRRQMLSPRWRDIGIATASRAAAPGVYGDDDVTVVTADFGVRR